MKIKIFILLVRVTRWPNLGTSAQQNRRRKNESTWLYLALIKKKFVCQVNSFAFNGNLLHWKHDHIFALPLRLPVNHYCKLVISTQSQ